MSKIRPPWTDDQVAALNAWQHGPMHPFTCGGNHAIHVILEATTDGWVCPDCPYTQDWAHDFMADPMEGNDVGPGQVR